MKIYFASDHAGFETKNALVQYVRDMGHTAEDCGAHTYDINDDYPDIIKIAGKKLAIDVAAGVESVAVIAGGSGQGESIVMNRFKGVRCMVYYGQGGTQVDATGNTLGIIESARQHNNANAMSLGLRFLSLDEAKEAVHTFISTPFSGVDRHIRRIVKIDAIL